MGQAMKRPKQKRTAAKRRTNVRRRNPDSQARLVSQAAKLYKDFSGHEAKRGRQLSKPKVPDVLVNIGRVDGILYQAKRDGKTERYIHEFAAHARPVLAVAPDGSALFLLGGRYTFTDRGIVDHRK